MVETGDIRIDKIMPHLFEPWAKLPFEKCLESKGIKFKKLKKKEIKSKGKYPAIDQGEKFIAGYVDDESDVYAGILPLIVFGDHTRRIKYIDFEFAVGADGTKLLHPFEYLHPKFFYYYLNALNLESQGYSRHYRFLKEIAVPIPSLNEQHRIVAKLEKLLQKVDACKERLDKIPTILKRFRQSIIAAACSGRLTADWREKNPDVEPASVLLEQICKQKKNKKPKVKNKKTVPSVDTSDLPQLPVTWKWSKIGEVSDNIHYGYTASSKNKPIGPKLLRITDIQNNTVKWETVPYCRIDDKQKIRYLLKKGDLVFARTGATVGKSYLLSGKFPESVFASYLIRIILNESISKKYIYNFFQSLSYWQQITSGQVGIGQPNVNAQILSGIILSLPPLAEQHEIVRRVEALFKIADQIEERYKKAKAYVDKLTQSILAKAFRGELVSQDPNDEPASELLKKIKNKRNYDEEKSKKIDSAKKHFKKRDKLHVRDK